MPDVSKIFQEDELHHAIVWAERAKLRILSVLDHCVAFSRHPEQEKYTEWITEIASAHYDFRAAAAACQQSFESLRKYRDGELP